jgi:hypothetical protein
MVKLRIEDLKRFFTLKENQTVLAGDGEVYYSVVRRGDVLIIKERG